MFDKLTFLHEEHDYRIYLSNMSEFDIDLQQYVGKRQSYMGSRGGAFIAESEDFRVRTSGLQNNSYGH